MARVFISYKRDDKDLVFPLKDKIEAAIGEPCWIDLRGIESDAMFVEVIMSAIDDASIFLFMYSKRHSIITDFEHDWTIRELGYAEDERKRIVFCNIDKTPLTKWFKFMYKYKQQVDMTSPEDLGRLLEDLREWLDVPNNTQVKQEPSTIIHRPLQVQSSEKLEISSKQEPIVYTEGLAYKYDDQKKEAILNGRASVKDKQIIIPPEVQYNGQTYRVTSIGRSAFFRCKDLISVVLPDSVKRIEENAFEGCKGLKTITIPNSIVAIGKRAFYGCDNLAAITLPKGLKTIEESVFSCCGSLTTIVIPTNVTSIGKFAFSCCGLTDLTIPHGVRNIEENAFSSCERLASVILPSSIESIEPHAFSWCGNLSYIDIPYGVKNIGEYAFWGCVKLSSLDIPNSVDVISTSAFAQCVGLQELLLPNNLKSIQKFAFEGCTQLKKVCIPESVNMIEAFAFSGCSRLEMVELPYYTKLGNKAFPSTCRVIRQ